MYATFETDLVVRPDDIDMNKHVHNSRYLDYVLAARYDQMDRCYGMSMEEFLHHGYSWVNSSCTIDYKRPLRMGDAVTVRTRIVSFSERGVRVEFWIVNKGTGKVAAQGHQDFIMVDVETGRSLIIPDWIVERYAITEDARGSS